MADLKSVILWSKIKAIIPSGSKRTPNNLFLDPFQIYKMSALKLFPSQTLQFQQITNLGYPNLERLETPIYVRLKIAIHIYNRCDSSPPLYCTMVATRHAN